jgi:hypothetical protein
MMQIYRNSVSYDEFLPEVLQYVPDVPELVAANAVRSSCIEFCERTRFWQQDTDPIELIAGVSNYEFDGGTGVKFVDIVTAWCNDTLLVPKSTEELARLYRHTDWRNVKGDPAFITRMLPTEIILVPEPIKAGAILKLRAAYAPTRSSTSVDSTVYEEYLEIIAYGARARLYNTPKQSYFDKASATEFEKRFRVGITEARVRVNRGMTRAFGQIEFQRIT